MMSFRLDAVQGAVVVSDCRVRIQRAVIQLRIKREFCNQFLSRALPSLDVRQLGEGFVLALNQIDRSQNPRAGFTAAVSAARRLNDTVHTGGEADHTGKGDVHSGLNDLGRDANCFFVPLPQSVSQLVQCISAVSHAHGSRKGEQSKVSALQQAVQTFRLALFIADDQ